MSLPTISDLIDRMEKVSFMKTKRGLFFTEVAILWIASPLLKLFLPIIWVRLSSVLLMLIYCIFWLFFSGRLFLPAKMNILFAIDVGTTSYEYIGQIKKKIKETIDDLSFSEKINIIDMPEDCSFSTRSDAEHYAKSRGINLLVWGYSLDGKEEGNSVSEFQLKFTYVFSYRNIGELRNKLNKHIESHLHGRYWKIIEDSSIEDMKVVSSNIVEVSLYIVGVSMHLRGDINASIEIFERLKYVLTTKNEQSEIIQKMLNSANRYLVEAYRFKGGILRNTDIGESKTCSEKILKIDPDDSGAHLDIAKACYVLDGDIEKAKYHTNKVTDPLLKPLTNYNRAFFAIKENNCEDVLRFYQKIKTNPSQNIVDIIGFLQDEFGKDIDNILYFFGLGYINIYHLDVSKGIEQLALFIDKASDDIKYKELVSNAQRLLDNRKKKSKIVPK